MKDYPSIDGSGKAPTGQYCYVFNKIDGSQIRTAWTKKKGWHQWGTRRRLFDHTDPEFSPAISIFEKKYAEGLEKVFVDFKDFKKPEEVVVFMEFFGPNSFAGWHDVKALKSVGFDVENNDPKDVVVFDVNIHKRGLVGPKNFIKAFGHLPIAELVYSGFLTEDFVKDVRDGKIVTGEGVVCKWGEGHNLGMCKIKTNQYLDELRSRFGVGWKVYGE